MIRTLEEQKEYVRVCIGKEMANLMLAQTSDAKYTANENLDYLYGILESLEDRR